ncbi:DUF4384 domain-containing protein [Ottowia sp. GY511]|uniref:DUF4384 domain-containing protein n=1 Tax=Ottowia flava TaxID=2675430 RepID=A0ABW4KQ36_9BURK|nr:DUF4384 domain-containing protein [Ottowia sp. GY511]TXK29592.1 DUF4384 domain-containing protein [Ottowia sp. GY511]
MCLLGLGLISGCAPLDPRRDTEYHEAAFTADRPTVRPVRSISSFSESLVCMDHMLRAANLPTTLITSKQFPDFSGKVPAAVKDMVITSLSQMSHVSNAFRFVDFEVDIARQDTVQNLSTILLNNNQMQLQRPALYVSGAIAFVDQNVLSNRLSAGTSASRLDTGYSNSKAATVVALEAHLGDFRTRTIIPGLDSANEVVIGGAGQGFDLAGRIGDYGVKFNIGRDYALGAGGAVRTLVDLAMIELVGKWARVPYWQCLMLDQTNPNFQRQMRDWYAESGPAGQFALVKASLISRGYLPAGSEVMPINEPAMRYALSRFQSDRGVVVSGVVDFPTYDAALRNFVALNESGALSRIGWASNGPMQITGPEGQRVAGLTGGTPAPWLIDMQIENPQPAGERQPFTEGEQIFLSARVNRTSHLYCYFIDSRGQTMRILPNALQPNSLVSANLAVRIPDWMGPNPGFILDAGRPGVETVICLATAQAADPLLPPELQGRALTALIGVNGAEGLQQRYAAAMGSAGYVTQLVQWNVVPRPAPAPTEAAPATK